MLASELLDLRGRLHKQGVIFAYSGYVTEPVLSGVGEALKQKLTIDDADTKTLRSVFAVFVEQMQNMIRYSAEKAEGPLPPASDQGGVAAMEMLMRVQRWQYGFNGVGLPGLAAPMGVNGRTPIGVQLVAGRFREDLLFDAAEVLEQRCGRMTPIDPAG